MTSSTEGLIPCCKIVSLSSQQVHVWALARGGLLFVYFLDEVDHCNIEHNNFRASSKSLQI
jgi:hypothetical protein